MEFLSYETELLLSDDAFLARCTREAYQASGAGGQKRNRVLSGVRLIHRPTGLRAEDCSGREAHRNLKEALAKLRLELCFSAIAQKQKLSGNYDFPESRISKDNPRYPFFVWLVLGQIVEDLGEIKGTANRIGWSSSALTRQIGRDSRVSAFFHKLRDQNGLRRMSLG